MKKNQQYSIISKLVVFFLLASLCRVVPAQSHLGTLNDYTFYSQALAKEMTCRVYLPPEYQPSNSNLKFPVIYSLHGATSVGYGAYDLIYPIIDALWLSQIIQPFILVMPDGRATPYSGSMYTNSVLYGNYQDYLVQDVIPFIDQNFHTLNDKYKRAIMGHSMGSYGALKLAFQYPDLFIGVAGHSGPLNHNMLHQLVPDLKAENGGTAPYTWAPTPGKNLTGLAFTLAGAFSPNLSETYLVDFPLNSDGNIREDVMERWLPHNIAEIARNFSAATSLGIYFDCGNQDDFHLQYQNRALSDTLQKYGIHHQYQEYFGDHNTGLPLRVPIALRFIDQLFRATVSVGDFPNSDVRISIYPNPTNESITITLNNWMDQDELFHLTCSDMTGKICQEWNFSSIPASIRVDHLPPGIYLISLSDQNRMIGKEKLVIQSR